MGEPSGPAEPDVPGGAPSVSPAAASTSASTSRATSRGSSRGSRIVLALLAALWLWPLAIPLVDRADSAGYVSVTASLVEEGDVLLVDEYTDLQVWERYARISPTGLAAHHWSPGVGIAMVPAYAAVRMAAPDRPLPSKAAYAALQATGLAWALLLAALLWRLARGVPSAVRLGLVAVCFVATPLAYYTHAQAIRPHLLEALLVAAFLVTHRDAKPGTAKTLGLGCIVAGVVLVRPQMAAVVLVVVPGLLSKRARTPWRDQLRPLLPHALAFALPVVGALLLGRGFAQLLYGDDRGSVLDAIVHAQYHPWDVLMSAHHGLLTWSPVFVVAGWGLWRGARDRDPWAYGLLAFFVVQWLLNGSSYEQAVDAYHHTRHVEGGFGFGARRFVGVVPLAVWGLARAWTQTRPGTPRRVLAAVLGLLAVHGLVLTLDARPHPEPLLAPMTYRELAAWPVDALGRLPQTLGWWWSRRPDPATAFVAWWIGAAQVTFVVGCALAWRRVPAGQRAGSVWGLVVGLVALALVLGRVVAAQTRTHATEQREALQALAQRSEARRAGVQREILLEQARLHAARGDTARARLRYEAALAIRPTPDVRRELQALPAD